MNRAYHLHQKQKASHTQSAPFFTAKQGVDFQLQLAAPLEFKNTISYSQNTYPWYGREGISFQKGIATKIMNPASTSPSSTLLSATSDSSAHRLQEGPKTKIVVRGLPPSLSERGFRDSISPRFDELLKWVSFWPGKVSTRKSRNSRAYIGFMQPGDVFKFYEEFNGHVFVSEKGTRYKAIVSCAPHQGVPKFSLKDTEEGSILADPDYSDFVSGLSKPTESLPSAEVQLERREAEKRLSLGLAKENVVVTPLMQYVRETRALKDQQVSMAKRKQIFSQENSPVVNRTTLSKGLPEISRDSLKYVSKATKPTQGFAYVPCSCHNVKECKESVTVTKSETAFQGKGGVVSRGRVLARSRSEDQKDENDMGLNKHFASRQARKECRPQQADLGKKSKNICGFRGPEKQVWVAKSASGILAQNSMRKFKQCA